MDSKTIAEWFEKHANEHCRFESIKEQDRLHPSEWLCGLLKIATLLRNPSSFEMRAEHDEVYLPGADEFHDNVTEADIVYLLQCGIGYCSDLGCLHKFT